MDIAATASTSGVQTRDAVSIMMLRKTLDLQQAMAVRMIAALPQPAPVTDPSATVGRSIDTYA